MGVRDDVGVSIRFELERLFLRLAVAVGAAVVLAALWALAQGRRIRHTLGLGCYIVGGLSLLLAASGGSPSRRDASSASWIGQAVRRDTFRVNAESHPTGSLGPAVLFVAVAVVLTLLGWVIS